MTITSFKTIKISYADDYELNMKLQQIDGKILSIKSTVPDATDTKHWISIYIEYLI